MLRVPNACERERLLMYPVGATFETLPASVRSKNPQTLEEARCCLLGLGFHCGAVAFIVGNALVQWKAQDLSTCCCSGCH